MNGLFELTPLILQTLIWPITRPCLRFFCRLEIKGLENLAGLRKGVVFASNHASELDPILVPASLPFLSPLMPMFYTSREKSFYQNSGWRQLFYGGFFFKLWGSHPLNPGKKDYALSLKTHIEIVKLGHSVLIFPEGRRTLDGNFGEARGGVAYLSYATKAPIIPVLLYGQFRMGLFDFFFRRRRIVVRFGRPIFPDKMFTEPVVSPADYYREKAEGVLSDIRDMVAKLD